MPRSIIRKADGVPIAAIRKLVNAEKREAVAIEKAEAIQAEIDFIESPLSEQERQQHDEKVANLLANFSRISTLALDSWADLKWIKENRTYREKYATFPEFCRLELARDNSTVYRVIKDAEFKDSLMLEATSEAERGSIINLKESNTRWIRTLPEEAQLPFWKLAYEFALKVLPIKEDGTVEPTTAFLESVGEKINELSEHGGITLNGEFIPVERIQQSAENEEVSEDTAKALLLGVGLHEDYYERIQRQKQRIAEKSAKADFIVIRGTVNYKADDNGNLFPYLIDERGIESNINELLLGFNNRYLQLSFKAPIR